jgi:small subunit ribosomal protein S1
MQEREEDEVEVEEQKDSSEESYWRMLLSQGEVPAGEEPPAGEPEEDEEEDGGEASPEDIENEWQRLQGCFSDGEILKCEVVGYNRGGLLAELELLRGFVPASLVFGMPRGLDGDERRDQLASYVGQELELKIIELNRSTNRVVLSERDAVPSHLRTAKVLERISEGEMRRGRVSGICDFGAFVDVGGVDGLIHISELSWGRVGHASEVLAIGDWVDVHVLAVDHERRRIALSLKQLHPDPWSLVEESYQIGQVVEGTISGVVDFGAFARIEDGVEGLIHISELAEGDFMHPRNVVQQGDQVTMRILKIDSQNRRMALSLRQV